MARAAFPALQVTAASWRDEALARVQAVGPMTRHRSTWVCPMAAAPTWWAQLRRHQPAALPVVVTIYDDDDHLFPALQAGAFGHLLKEQPQDTLVSQLAAHDAGRATAVTTDRAPGAGPLFAGAQRRRTALVRELENEVSLTERETEVLQRVAKGLSTPARDCPAVRPVAPHHCRLHQADLPQAQCRHAPKPRSSRSPRPGQP